MNDLLMFRNLIEIICDLKIDSRVQAKQNPIF